DLVRQRVTVVRRTTLEHVADVDALPWVSRTQQQQVEQLARPPHEGQPAPVLLLTRRLTNHHDFRVGGTITEHDLRPAPSHPAATRRGGGGCRRCLAGNGCRGGARPGRRCRLPDHGGQRCVCRPPRAISPCACPAPAASRATLAAPPRAAGSYDAAAEPAPA